MTHDPTTSARMAQHWEMANTATTRQHRLAGLRRRAPRLIILTIIATALAILAIMLATRPASGGTPTPAPCVSAPLAPQTSPRPVRNPIYGGAANG